MSLQLKPYKKEFDYSYSFGVFPTVELVANRPQSVLKVLVSAKGEKNEGVRKLRESCRKRNIEFEVNDRLVERLSPKENSYAIGVFSKYEATLSAPGAHVILVNPGDMGNLGTIIRTMLGFGVADLALIRPAVDIFDPRVVRASMGAIFRANFQYFDSLQEYSQMFGHHLYLFMTDGEVELKEANFREPFALVFGNESAGLPDEYRRLGASVSIRHSQAIDSLNLPVAVSIGLYEATRGTFEN
ncbi:MAG TPA: TrmH family RNA methyltransferase [Chloroflexia bacterium]|nr:TrmH family RNA methyltransferase [Chloroflexia bacterium]